MTQFVIERALLTDVGRKRSHNEDYVGQFEPADPDELAASGRLYIVADGVAGGAAGEIASKYAVKKILYEYYRATEPDLGRRLKAVVRAANADLFDYVEQRPELGRMGTTLVAVVVHGDELVVCNVGDSRAYLIRDREIHQITRDHSLVAKLVEEGSITPEEAKTHPRRNVVLRSLGIDAKVNPDIFDGDLRVQDRILLCSDGLMRHVSDDEILGMVTRTGTEQAVEELVDLANVRGGRDNISVVLLHLTEVHSSPARLIEGAGRTIPAEPEFDDLDDTEIRRRPVDATRRSPWRLWPGRSLTQNTRPTGTAYGIRPTVAAPRHRM